MEVNFKLDGKQYKYTQYKIDNKRKSRLFEEGEEIFPKSIREYLSLALKKNGGDPTGLNNPEIGYKLKKYEKAL